MARENPGAARRLAGTSDAVRAEDFNARKMRNRRVSELNAGLEVGCRRIESLYEVIHRSGAAIDERNDDRLWAGFDRKFDFEWNLSASTAASNVVIGGGAQVEQHHTRAVDAHFQLLALGRGAVLRAEIHFQERELEQIFAVDRKVVRDLNSAARPHGQAGNVVILREVAADF